MLGWLFRSFGRVFSRRGSTALVLLQPAVLLCQREPPVGVRHFEGFVPAARSRGAFIVHISDSNALWWRLVELSDLLFVFPFGYYRKLKRYCWQRGLSPGEKAYLLKKEVRPHAGETDYPFVAERLSVVFRERGIRRMVVCGGLAEKCATRFLREMNLKMPGLKVVIASGFFAGMEGGGEFVGYLRHLGIPVEVSDGDAGSLLGLF